MSPTVEITPDAAPAPEKKPRAPRATPPRTWGNLVRAAGFSDAEAKHLSTAERKAITDGDEESRTRVELADRIAKLTRELEEARTLFDAPLLKVEAAKAAFDHLAQIHDAINGRKS